MTSESDVDRWLEEQRWETEIAAASPVVRAWCQRFLAGAKLNAHANIYERAGFGLARLAPERFRKRPDQTQEDS